MRMALVGRHERISAQRALELGMISQVVDPPDQLRDAAQAESRRVSAASTELSLNRAVYDVPRAQYQATLREFRIDAVTEGQDALGEVSVVVRVGEESASGQGVATDIVEAAARAYLRALTTLARGARTVTKPESAPAEA